MTRETPQLTGQEGWAIFSCSKHHMWGQIEEIAPEQLKLKGRGIP